jgi:hypothetical protein
MPKAAIAFAALITAASVASSPALARSGGSAGGEGKPAATTHVNKSAVKPAKTIHTTTQGPNINSTIMKGNFDGGQGSTGNVKAQ